MPRRHLQKQTAIPVVVVFLAIGSLVLLLLAASRQSLFLQRERVTLALATSSPAVLSFNKSTGEISLLLIPTDTYIDVPADFGSYRVGALWHLGRIEKRDGELLRLALRSFLGIPIDGWVGWQFKAPQLSGSKETLVKSLVNQVTPVTFSGGSTLTSLGPLDRLLLWFFLLRTRLETITAINLEDKGVLVQIRLSDGSPALLGSPDLVDKVSQTLYSEKLGRNEDLPIRILNAGNRTGVGAKIARLLTNVGFEVVSVANADDKSASPCILVVPSKAQKRPGIERLQELLDCQLRLSDSVQSEGIITIGEEAKLW